MGRLHKVQAADHCRADRRADRALNLIDVAPSRRKPTPPQTGKDFVGGIKRSDKRASICVPRFGQRQHGGDHVTGMTADAGVVEIETADHAGVGERRMFRCRSIRQADNRRSLPRSERGCEPAGDCGWLRLYRAERTAERVDQVSLGRIDRRARQVLELKTGRISGHCTRRRIENAREPQAAALRVLGPDH